MHFDILVDVLTLSLAVAAISMAITKAEVGRPLRNFVSRVSKDKLTYLINCPFCTGFWVSTIGTWLFTSHNLLTSFAVWGAATMFVGLMMRALFIQENEIGLLEQENAELRRQLDAVPAPAADPCPNYESCKGQCFVCDYFDSETQTMKYPEK